MTEPTSIAKYESTTAVRTVRELTAALTKLAGELPRGLDTPVEVGLTFDDGSFDTSAAFSVEAVIATWPGFRPDGADCRHTTLSLIGDLGHPDADRYSRHIPTASGHPDWEDPPAGQDLGTDRLDVVEEQAAEVARHRADPWKGAGAPSPVGNAVAFGFGLPSTKGQRG
jgi:hypothetical protein